MSEDRAGFQHRSEDESGKGASPAAAHAEPAVAVAAVAAAPAGEPALEVAAVVEGGAQARGAPSRGGRPRGLRGVRETRGLRATGSGAVVWAALLVGLLVVVGAGEREPVLVRDGEQIGEVAAQLRGLPGAFGPLPGAACLSWDGGDDSDGSRAGGGCCGCREEGRWAVAIGAPGCRERDEPCEAVGGSDGGLPRSG